MSPGSKSTSAVDCRRWCGPHGKSHLVQARGVLRGPNGDDRCDGVEVGPYCLVGPHVELKDGVHLTGNETLERARTLFDEMQREYASGNFARYGELLQQLGKLLQAQ